MLQESTCHKWQRGLLTFLNTSLKPSNSCYKKTANSFCKSEGERSNTGTRSLVSLPQHSRTSSPAEQRISTPLLQERLTPGMINSILG